MRMAGPEVTGSPGDSDYVRVDNRGEVAVVTLDHQPDRNALSWAMTLALSGAVAAIQAEGRAGALGRGVRRPGLLCRRLG